MKPSVFCLLAAWPLFAAEKPAALPPLATPGWGFEELRRFKAPEARQGVAVDGEHFYAINNHAIGKYRKDTGARVSRWEGLAGGPIIHLNAGIVRDGKLLAVHSNYPGVPMLSSLEIFDPGTLRHIGTHSFGRMDGSFTWLDRRKERWIACFVHYGGKGAEPARDSAWTQIIEFDSEWRRTAGWALPANLSERFGGRGYSASGGAFGPGGHLYVTGHDNTEMYVLGFPEAGSVMTWMATFPIPAEGQAFCFDPSAPDILYTILKRTTEVIVGRVRHPSFQRPALGAACDFPLVCVARKMPCADRRPGDHTWTMRASRLRSDRYNRPAATEIPARNISEAVQLKTWARNGMIRFADISPTI